MDLSKKNLPSAIIVGGKSYQIHTEHYFIFSLIKVFKQPKIEADDFNFIFTDKIPKDKNQALQELLAFVYPKKELPRRMDEEDETILLDYDLDSDLIYSAFMENYHIDLFETPLHWHKFMALLSSLQNTKLNKVMEFRCYKPAKHDSPEYKQNMNKLKKMWQIEDKISEEEQKILDDFDRMIAERKAGKKD